MDWWKRVTLVGSSILLACITTGLLTVFSPCNDFGDPLPVPLCVGGLGAPLFSPSFAVLFYTFVYGGLLLMLRGRRNRQSTTE
jgi:hypothetical protein